MSLPFFQPFGNTVLIAATSSTGVAPTQISTSPGASAVRLSYPSTSGTGVPIYIAIGSSSVAASVPTTSTPSAGIALTAGNVEYLSFPQNLTNNWISAVTSAGTAAPGLYVTPGSGR